MRYSLTILFLLLAAGIMPSPAYSQLQLGTTAKINTKCNGVGCNYYGPSILINEVMIKPYSGDGSIYGMGPGASNPQSGEWIELFNPHLCKSVDISCYFLGNNATDNSLDYGGGFELPPGTVVPPRGYCVVRGIYADPVPAGLLVQNGGNTVEVIIHSNSSVCVDGGYRLWFPNAGGWFAFYNQYGIAQDAISWNLVETEDNHPCNPDGNCPYGGLLASYSQIPPNKKHYIFSSEPVQGFSIRRQPDGGLWAVDQYFSPTQGAANGVPIPAPVITCNGKAMVNVTGGNPPYTFLWDDGQSQVNDTAVGLCEGTYCVTVTDANGLVASACVQVLDFIPVVSLGTFDTLCESAAPFTMTQGSPPGGFFSGPGVSGNTFNPAVAGEGTHKLYYEYYNADSCYNIDSSLIAVLPGISISMPPPLDLCISNPGFTLSGANPPGGTYTGNGVVNGYFSPQAAGPGIDTIFYNITTSSYCTSTGTMTIAVHPLPVLTLEPVAGICENSPPFPLTEGLPAGGTYSGEGIINNIFYPAVTGTGTFPFTYAYADEYNCYNDTSGLITVSSLPAIHASADPEVICRGDSSSLNGFGAQQYTWIPLQVTNQSLSVSPYNTTVYEVIGVDANGCVGTDSCMVTVIPLPEVDLPDAVWLMTGEVIDLSCYSGSYQYLWSTGSDEHLIHVSRPGIYWVKVADAFCVTWDTVEVVEIPAIYVPNAFTPDGDGLNDFFGPVSAFPMGIEFHVFNRWGEEVYRTTNPEYGWDGNFKGGLAPCDVYTWLLKWEFTHLTPHKYQMSLTGKKQGSVLLVR